MMKRSKGEKIFAVFNTIILIGLSIVCLIPMWHVIMASVSDPYSVGATHSFIFYPLEKPNVEAYKIILRYQGLWRGYLNTIIYTVSQCFLAAFCSCIGGYIMARKQYRYRGLFTIFLLIPMFFNGGMIPTYLLVRDLGMLDTMWAILLPTAISVWNLIITRTYFQTSIPQEILESASIDGCNDFQFLIRMVIPLSVPILAVNVLLYAVGHWNSYFNEMIYLSTNTKYPLQLILRDILLNDQSAGTMDVTQQLERQKTQYLLQYSSMVVGTVPLMLLYPAVQKYFIKGIMVGAVKG